MGLKEKTEGATLLGRTTRELIEKWNQTTAEILDRGRGGDIRSAQTPFSRSK